MSLDETPLTGGNVSEGVVRVGDTVRRPTGYWTPAVHALLTHLHDVGFPGAPRALGIDEQGREVLSFAPGEAVYPDHLELVASDHGLARVARLIRDLHTAVAGFTPPPDARWQVLIPDPGADLIVHHDLAPWNLVAGGDVWTFIDWDTAAPGTRLWDVAYALHGFVPLTADPALRPEDDGQRIRVFADAYGLDEAERRALAPPCSLLEPARCTTSWGLKPPCPSSRGHACGTRGMATTGATTPTTSSGTSPGGPSSCSAEPVAWRARSSTE